jgi:transmembrane sensor
MSGELLSDQRERTVLGEARDWVVRLASGKVTAEDAASFRRWHATSPAHARAFAEAKQHWRLMGEAAAQGLVPQRGFNAPRRAGLGGAINRRWLLGAGVGAAAAGVVLTVRPPFDLWPPLFDFAADYRTGIGEKRTIAMREDVTVELSTRSRLSLQSDRPEGLRIRLLAGEAAIASSACPVVVLASNGEIRTASGRFNLRIDDGAVGVTCLEGAVDVACGNQERTLRANEQIRYAARGLSSVTIADPDEITAWQHGVLVFRNRSLGYVVDEINRYRPGRIILMNRALGGRPVALASFHLDRLDEVVPQIEALYGATARYLPGGIVLLT